eukprot:gene10733-29476_t
MLTAAAYALGFVEGKECEDTRVPEASEDFYKHLNKEWLEVLGGATAILPPNSAKWRPPPTPTRPISAAARAALASAAALAERSGRGSSRKKTTAAAPAAPAAPAVIQINTLNSKFPIIGEAAKECGYEVVSDENMEADVFWFDGPSPPEIYRRMENHQKVNNFPATGEISRKDCLSRNIARLQQAAPEEFDFVPRGWIIPAELSALQKHDVNLSKRGKAHSYIVKPVNSAMGRGIFLITSVDQLYNNSHFTKADSAIVYLHDPLLIDGFKFDLRIYVLVTSCDPLRAFMYKDGLVRLSCSKNVAYITKLSQARIVAKKWMVFGRATRTIAWNNTNPNDLKGACFLRDTEAEAASVVCAFAVPTAASASQFPFVLAMQPAKYGLAVPTSGSNVVVTDLVSGAVLGKYASGPVTYSGQLGALDVKLIKITAVQQHA